MLHLLPQTNDAYNRTAYFFIQDYYFMSVLTSAFRQSILTALWLPLLLIALSCASLKAQTLKPVYFANGKAELPANFNVQSRAAIPTEDITDGHFVRYVQFSHVLTDAERTTLENTGARIAGYVDFGAYELVLPIGYDFSVAGTLGAQSMMTPQANWRLHHNLIERPLGAWAVQGDAVDVVLQVYPHIGIERGAVLAREANMRLLEKGNQNGCIWVRIQQSDIEAHARLPWVKWIEQIPPPDQKDDLNGRSLHRSNLLDSDHPLGRKFDGTGVKVLVRDDGEVGPHIDFQGRLFNQPNTDPPFSGTHGDGVGGIIGGAGNLDPTKRGMAAGCDVYVVDYTAGFQDQTLPLHINEGVTITNTSYSNGCNDGYTTAAQTVDDQIFDNPTLMHVFSAGNSNNNDCGYGAGTSWGNITGGHKMGKNAIATANLAANSTIDNSSSRGPANDGRLKPDIAAHGAGQNSTDPGNEYQVFGGTSAAAPGIAGCLAQLTHAYRELNNTSDAPAGLLKMALLNTTNELGDIGPDFVFGWGHVNTYRALGLLEEERYLSASVSQGGTNTHTLEIPAGTQQARLMLYWVDPAGSTAAAKALVNDLDLKVTGPNGTVHLPWRLDPTPIAANLDAPATRGRDSLNNVEQVALDAPLAGAYTVEIAGFGVPQGPQPYYLGWEYIKDDIKLTYPAGGEGFVPGTQEWLRWDALPSSSNTGFTLRYSVDDGANWLPITTTGASARMHQWTVPNATSGKVRLLVIRGTQRDTTDYPLTISPVPTGISVDTVCPSYMRMSWRPVNNILAYDAFVLGAKTMELKATVSDTFAIIPLLNASLPQWVSARTSSPDGLAGRRAIAIPYEGGLKNCAQPTDAALKTLVNLSSGTIRACGASSEPVVVRVANEGLTSLTNAAISYQFNNGAIVSEPLPDIAPNTTYDHNFSEQIALNFNGVATIKAWVSADGEGFRYNDTLTQSLTVISQSATINFTQGFESANLPTGWTIENPDNLVTWGRSDLVTGFNGNDTRAMWIDNFNYNADGEEDLLYLIPLNLTNATNPGLSFTYSHATYPGSVESLRIEAFAGCDLSQAPTVLWEKSDPDLGSLQSTSLFVPTAANQWRSEVISLQQFIGQQVVLRFVTTNDFGNSTYLDNVGLVTYNPVPPLALFNLLSDTICRGDTLTFNATPSPGANNQYAWNFGSAAFPATATGDGPHAVFFPAGGPRNIRLIVTNAFGADTLIRPLRVLGTVNSNFTSAVNGTTVTFTNTTAHGETFLWAFGDGETSTEANPVHTYAAPGTYTVTLTAGNRCQTTTSTRTAQVNPTSSTIEAIGLQRALVMPNPTQGIFYVEISSDRPATTATLRLLDASGRVVQNKESVVIPTGQSQYQFDGTSLPTGLYQIQVTTELGVAVLPVVIE
jgi:PKD repeat protein